jgi:hypothetical protein
MTVSNVTNKMVYTGNSSTLIFPYTFKIYEDTDLEVKTIIIASGVSTDLVLNTDYTVSGVGNPSGGNVTLLIAAPPNTVNIVIRRVLPLTQELDYIEADQFPAETHEEGLDRGIMIDQQMQDDISRCIQLAENITGVSVILPPPTAYALLGWNATADALVNYVGTDYRVAVDDAAVPGTLGASAGVGVLRVDSTMSKADGGDFITLGVNAAGIDHDALLNFVANEHIDHSAVSIINGTGITGGGDLTASRTLSVVDNTTTQKVEVVKNSGVVVGTRKQLNFIEGSNVTLTIADDGVNDQVDITIAAAGGGGGVTLDGAYDQGGAGAGRTINADSGAVQLLGTNAADHTLEIQQNSVLGSGKFAMYVYTNSAQTNANLVRIFSDNAASTTTMVAIINDGSGSAVVINESGTLAASNAALYVTSDTAQTNGGYLAAFVQDSASSTDPAVYIQNDGTGDCVRLNQVNTGGAHINLAGDPANASPTDGDLWFTGSQLNFRNGATTVDLLSVAGGSSGVLNYITKGEYLDDFWTIVGSSFTATGGSNSQKAEAGGVFRLNQGADLTIKDGAGAISTFILASKNPIFTARVAPGEVIAGAVKRIGFGSAVLNADPSNGIFIKWANGLSAGNYVGVCRSGGVESTADLAIAHALATYVKLRIIVTSGSVGFYIDDVLKGTITTNIPSALMGVSAGQPSSPGAPIQDIDYIHLVVDK